MYKKNQANGKYKHSWQYNIAFQIKYKRVALFHIHWERQLNFLPSLAWYFDAYITWVPCLSRAKLTKLCELKWIIQGLKSHQPFVWTNIPVVNLSCLGSYAKHEYSFCSKFFSVHPNIISMHMVVSCFLKFYMRN